MRSQAEPGNENVTGHHRQFVTTSMRPFSPRHAPAPGIDLLETKSLSPPRGTGAFDEFFARQQLAPIAAVGVHDVDGAALVVRQMVVDDRLAVGDQIANVLKPP